MTEWILSSSILILTVIALRTLFKGRISLRLQYAIWGLVLLRLLIPVSFGSTNFSVANLTGAAQDQPIIQVFHDVGNLNVPSQSYEDAYQQVVQEYAAEGIDVKDLQGSDLEALEYEAYDRMKGKSITETVSDIALVIWLAGIVLVGITFAATNIRFRSKILSTRYGLDIQKNNLDVYATGEIDTPCLFGIRNPAIYVTYPVAGNRTLLRHTLEHEATHHRHGDHIWAVLRCACLAVHWYNPLVWWAAVLSQRDAELACDEATIRRLGERERAEYGRTLIGMTCQKKANVLITATTMNSGKSGLKERIMLIARKPRMALYTLLIVLLIASVAVGCTFTGAKTNESESEKDVLATESAEEDDWGISLVPDRVSRTGATALFSYSGSVPGEGGAELTYGDFLSLDRLVNGEWVPCDELPGYEYFVGNSYYPVTDGYGMVHEWPDRFGELPDGTYRMGKLVTLHRADGTREEQMIYGSFTLPDSIRTGPIPLNELPEKYSGEQAMIDGCFVAADGTARENKDLFHKFVQDSWQGISGSIRIVDWHYGDSSYYVAYDLEYDGSMFTLTWYQDGQLRSREFPYIRHFVGENEDMSYEHYVLIHDEMIDRNIWGDMISSHASDYSDHMTVFSDYTYLPKTPQIPADLEKAVLEFEGQQLLATTDFDRLEKLYLLFTDAEFLGYEPKTHSVGVGLNLILTSKNGETLIIELNPDSDVCRINGEFVFYGAYDEPDYIEKLWYYLGIEAWPDEVYEKCSNAYRP